MIAADRAGVPLWEFMAQPTAWRELYRAAIAAERQVQHDLALRQARQAKAARMRGGR